MQKLRRAGWLLAALWAFGCSAGTTDEPESVASDEEALRIGGVCGGPRNRQCDDDEYCRTLVPGRCPGPRSPGVCLSRPQICPFIFAPVCGCDGRTYSNRCVANAAGVSVDHAGECEELGPFCGGIAGFPCPGAGQCADDPRDDCDPNAGGADCSGVCECNTIGLCRAGQHWDTSPEVCGCVPDENPCAAVLCMVGNECVVVGGEPVCVPIAGQPCGDVTCGAGTVCCNASCGICTPPGGVCIQIACD